MNEFYITGKVPDIKQFILLARLNNWNDFRIDSDMKRAKENMKVTLVFTSNKVDKYTITYFRLFQLSTYGTVVDSDNSFNLPKDKDKIFELIKK